MNKSEIENLVNRITKAKNVTQTLIEKSQEFAQFIKDKMDDVGVNCLMQGKYILKNIPSSTNNIYLYIRIDEDYGYQLVNYACLNVSMIDANRMECMLYGDFNATYNLPNRNDILEFMSDAKELLTELSNMDKTVETSLIDMILLRVNKKE